MDEVCGVIHFLKMLNDALEGPVGLDHFLVVAAALFV